MGCAIMALATLIELLGCNRDLHTVVTSLKHFSEELMRIGSYEVVKYRGHTAEGAEIVYLRGTKFSHFLGVFLRKARLSDFFFIQVGAHNGVSNDHLNDFIVKFGLRGILVEPQPHVFAELSRNYSYCPALKLENVAIADEGGERPSTPSNRSWASYRTATRLHPSIVTIPGA
jgi:hypothetical protein